MKEALISLLFLISVQAKNFSQNEQCHNTVLTHPTIPTRLKMNISDLADNVISDVSKNYTFLVISRNILLETSDILGVAVMSKLERNLALNVTNRLRIFPNKTTETAKFWSIFNSTKIGWNVAIKDCDFLRSWVYSFIKSKSDVSVGIFVKIELNQCDRTLADIFNGSHRCDEETTEVSELI